ncbi:hypothetical protein DL96DRAFT_1723154 [Flagelloscypha sp. PMI_526]|nr:hypothetical protein DL96DRAFT_1723154 [Flagelloscypha sp. PMI_526]
MVRCAGPPFSKRVQSGGSDARIRPIVYLLRRLLPFTSTMDSQYFSAQGDRDVYQDFEDSDVHQHDHADQEQDGEHGRFPILFNDSIYQHHYGPTPAVAYRPEEHIVRCFPNRTRQYDLAASKGFHQSFEAGDSMQQLILEAKGHPDFPTLMEERFERVNETCSDTEDSRQNRIIRVQVEMPSEWPIVRKFHASQVHAAIKDVFLLPWIPGWVYFVVRIYGADDLGPILQTLAQVEGIGRHFHFVGAIDELAPPETPPICADIITNEWVKMQMGPYTNDWGLVISTHGTEEDESKLDTPYPFARLVVVPRLCDSCHCREELTKGFEATLCSSCLLERPAAKLRQNLRDGSFCQRVTSENWCGVDPVTGLAVICVPIEYLDACSYMPHGEFAVFEMAYRRRCGEIGHLYEIFGNGFEFPRPLFASQVMRQCQPVWANDRIFIVVRVPADAAKEPKYTVILYDELNMSPSSNHPVHVEVGSQYTVPPLVPLPYLTEGTFVRVRSGRRAGLVYKVTRANRQTLWLTLQDDSEKFLWTKDWHNFEACSSNSVELEKNLINHFPPIYLEAPELPPVHRALISPPWIGRQVEILFPPYSAAHSFTQSMRKELGKHKYGQVTNLECTQDLQQFPSGVKVNVWIYGTSQTTLTPAFDLYEVKDQESNEWMHVAYSFAPPHFRVHSLVGPVAKVPPRSPVLRASTPVPIDGDISWGIPTQSEQLHADYGQAPPAHHSSEDTQLGFRALRHPSFLGKYLRVYVMHQGSEKEAWGRVQRIEEHLRFVYQTRGGTGYAKGSTNEGLLGHVVRWIALNDRGLKSIAAVTVQNENCQLFGERLVTIEQDKTREGICYIVCREWDVVGNEPTEVALFSISKAFLATEGDPVQDSVKEKAKSLRPLLRERAGKIQYIE